MTHDGLAGFLSMGGYGFYVWTAYAVSALAVAIEIVVVRARSRAAMRAIARSLRSAVSLRGTR